MPDTWVTITEAAQALNVSTSTIRRRIARAMLEARVDAHGRKQVRIPSAIAPEPQQDSPPDHRTTDTQPKPHSPTNSPEQAIQALYDPDQPRTFAPGDLLANTAPTGDNESEAHRYQRLAGAAIVLAQRQTDEAHDKLERLDDQHRRLRKLTFTSWAIFAALLLLTLSISWSQAARAGAAEQENAILTRALQQTPAQTTDQITRITQLENQIRQLRQNTLTAVPTP
ncbi:hypothetical protein [Mucisphaera sp.]|uniref:hypothetical protein n=1 Tax=Mucisphaera sp. TaxID=2913024 RepID=UPI003D0E653A